MTGFEEKLSQGSIDDLIASLLAGGGGGADAGPALGDDAPADGDGADEAAA